MRRFFVSQSEGANVICINEPALCFFSSSRIITWSLACWNCFVLKNSTFHGLSLFDPTYCLFLGSQLDNYLGPETSCFYARSWKYGYSCPAGRSRNHRDIFHALLSFRGFDRVALLDMHKKSSSPSNVLVPEGGLKATHASKWIVRQLTETT